MLLYDVIDFIPTNFKIKNEDELTEHLQEAKFSRHHSSSDTRISQNDSSVNDNFMQSPSEDSLNTDLDEIYSKKQTDAIQAHYAEVMRENRNLKNIISALDEMQYSSARNNIHLDGRDIRNIAGRLLRSASSKYELSTFENELTAIYEYIS